MKATRMPTISKLIELNGGIDNLEKHYIRIENGGYMRLVIERIGDFDKMPLISVAHYYEQNGDAMRDPEMTFAISGRFSKNKDWDKNKLVPEYYPVTFQQDGGLSLYQEAMYHDETGRSMCKPSLLTQLCSFARQWDKNLKDQGFIDAFAFDSAGNCKMCGEAGRCHCENPNIKEPK